MKVIAAVALDGAIGKDNKLLWNLPEDLKRYKDRTSGNVCIVGENTYYSLPDIALKDRTHIVIQDDKTKTIEGRNADVCMVHSIDEAIEKAKEYDEKEVFVIGGAQVYTSMIDHVDEVEVTWINQLYPDADRHFPIDKLFNEFEIIGDSNYIKSDNGILYKFTLYERINKRYKLSKDD